MTANNKNSRCFANLASKSFIEWLDSTARQNSRHKYNQRKISNRFLYNSNKKFYYNGKYKTPGVLIYVFQLCARPHLYKTDLPVEIFPAFLFSLPHVNICVLVSLARHFTIDTSFFYIFHVEECLVSVAYHDKCISLQQ